MGLVSAPTVYAELDDALAVVARASFYEDKVVTPVPGGWEVDDTTAHASDDWYWTYADGIADRDSVDETSRLHESYECYADASHIRYNLADSVAVLESRTHAVEFAYAVVTDADYRPEPWDNDAAGWILVASHYTVEVSAS